MLGSGSSGRKTTHRHEEQSTSLFVLEVSTVRWFRFWLGVLIQWTWNQLVHQVWGSWKRNREPLEHFNDQKVLWNIQKRVCETETRHKMILRCLISCWSRRQTSELFLTCVLFVGTCGWKHFMVSSWGTTADLLQPLTGTMWGTGELLKVFSVKRQDSCVRLNLSYLSLSILITAPLLTQVLSSYLNQLRGENIHVVLLWTQSDVLNLCSMFHSKYY